MDPLLRRGVRQFPHYLTSGFSDPDVNGVIYRQNFDFVGIALDPVERMGTVAPIPHPNTINPPSTLVHDVGSTQHPRATPDKL